MDRRALVIVRRWAAVLILTTGIGCRSADDVDVVFYIDNGHTFSRAEKATIRSIARNTAAEVRQLLPGLPSSVTIRVRAGTDVIPEVGATAEVSPPNIVYWTVDASRPERVSSIVEQQLRATLFHEFHHLVRGEARTLMEHVVAEGLATVFERDYASAARPWGDYPQNVVEWLPELEALPPDAPRDIWMVRRSRRSSVDLTALSAEEIRHLARGE